MKINLQHNERFKEAALTHGLTCDKSIKYGWTITGPTDELREWVSSNVRKGCFRFQKASTWADGTPKKPTEKGTNDKGGPAVAKKGGSNIHKYVCPKCGLIIRASKKIDNRVICSECKEFFVEVTL